MATPRVARKAKITTATLGLLLLGLSFAAPTAAALEETGVTYQAPPGTVYYQCVDKGTSYECAGAFADRDGVCVVSWYDTDNNGYDDNYTEDTDTVRTTQCALGGGGHDAVGLYLREQQLLA